MSHAIKSDARPADSQWHEVSGNPVIRATMDAAEQPGTVAQLLREKAKAHPERDAIVMMGRTLSYADLEAETARFARALIASGAGKGTRIALMAPDGIYWLIAFLGALRVGALVAAVSTLCKPPELAYILRNCDAQFFIAARRFLSHDYAKVIAQALPGIAGEPANAIRLPEAPFLRAVFLDDSDGLSWAASFDGLMARGGDGDARDDALLRAIEQEVVPADRATILYTSGSTAAPKAVLHRQHTLLAKSIALAEYFRIAPEDRMMPTLPIFWVGGMAMAIMVLAKGGTLIYPDAPDNDTLLRTLTELNATRVNSWGPRHRKLVQSAIDHGIDIETVGGLGPARGPDGTVIAPELFPNLLGMSESFSAHSGEWMDRPLPHEKAGGSGRAIGTVERRVVDPESGETLGPGETGELQIRGAAVMEGFYKRVPWDVFTPDGFYPTGDLVRIDTDGCLYFIARKGDFIKTSGANVSRLEVEQALLALPGISLAVAVGLPDGDLGERVVAAVVPDGSTALDGNGLRTQLSSVLSSYKVPRQIIVIAQDEIEWTATGTKINLPKMRDTIAPIAAKSA